MKKLILATVIAAIATGAAAAPTKSTIDKEITKGSGYINYTYDLYGNTKTDEISKINIYGAWGNDVQEKDQYQVLYEYNRKFVDHRKGKVFDINNYTRRNDDSHHKEWYNSGDAYDNNQPRDHVEYLVSNKGRNVTIAELGNTMLTDEDTGQKYNKDFEIAFGGCGNHLQDGGDCSDKDSGYTQRILDQVEDGANSYQLTWQQQPYTSDEVRIVVESNYNSKRWFHDVQEYDSIGSHFDSKYEREKIKEINVGGVSNNEQAKQVVAASVALMFNKFDNVSGKDVESIIFKSLEDKKWWGGNFEKSTITRMLAPIGNLD